MREEEQKNPFNPRKKLRASFLFVLGLIRLKRQVALKPATPGLMCTSPYSVKSVRRQIDACAFNIYGHWVKKGENQNRAALFQNTMYQYSARAADFDIGSSHSHEHGWLPSL